MENERRGVFLIPMAHDFAEKLIADLGAVALQLGPTGQEFYNGLVKGWEEMEKGNEGLLYEN